MLLLIDEFCTMWGGLHHHIDDWEWWVCGVSTALVLVLVAGGVSGSFKVQSPTFTNLMASAISPDLISVVYLLGFIMHLSWMTDGVLNYIMGEPLFSWLVPFVMGILGIVVLWITFPGTHLSKTDNRDVVFISGISQINVETVSYSYNGQTQTANNMLISRLTPLVRFLNLVFVSKEVAADRVSKMLILSSEINSVKNLEKNQSSNGEFVKELVIDVTERVKADDQLRSNLSFFCDVIDVTSGDEKRQIVRIEKKDENSILSTVIKVAALAQFPNQGEFIRDLTIEFTSKCDYDSFDDCFNKLRKAVEKEDNKKRLLYFNLTPGTGIVGSLMTLLSIDNDRNLYYYAQHSKLKEEKRLKPVDKSVIPFENLLSQALQKIKNPS